jgi:uncharacterized protein DUF1236
MRKLRPLAIVAAVVLIGTAAASAQNIKNDEAPGRAPAAQQNAPAEKIAPSIKRGEQKAGAKQKAPETTGQAPKASDADKTRATEKGDTDKSMEKGRAPKGSSDMKRSPDKKSSSDAGGGATMKSKANESAQVPDGAKSSQSTTSEKSNATTGQGAASSSAKLSNEQRTKITTILKRQKVEPAHLNVSMRVGTRVPESVHFYPLPVEVVDIYPEWRGYDYILVGDEIVVIDPRTHEIVAILES